MLDLQRFAACAWRKCSAVYIYASTRVNGGATPTGVASPARESNDMVDTKCGQLCAFRNVLWFCVVVAEWFQRRVYGVYVQALTNIYARCVVIIHMH